MAKFSELREDPHAMTSDADAMELRKKWRVANREFEIENCWGPDDGSPYRVTPRPGRVLVIAAHGVRHRRNSEMKENDANTGGLAIVLAERLEATLAVVRHDKELNDANWAVDHPFKRFLEQAGLPVPRTLVIDLHAMADRDGIEVSLGWRGHVPSKAPAGILADHLQHRDYCVDPDASGTGFGANGPGTITAWAQGHGAAAIQVEISHALRTFGPRSNTLRSGRFVADLAAGITAAAAADDQ
jgi:hypothetical protein